MEICVGLIVAVVSVVAVSRILANEIFGVAVKNIFPSQVIFPALLPPLPPPLPANSTAIGIAVSITLSTAFIAAKTRD